MQINQVANKSQAAFQGNNKNESFAKRAIAPTAAGLGTGVVIGAAVGKKAIPDAESLTKTTIKDAVDKFKDNEPFQKGLKTAKESMETMRTSVKEKVGKVLETPKMKKLKKAVTDIIAPEQANLKTAVKDKLKAVEDKLPEDKMKKLETAVTDSLKAVKEKLPTKEINAFKEAVKEKMPKAEIKTFIAEQKTKAYESLEKVIPKTDRGITATKYGALGAAIGLAGYTIYNLVAGKKDNA